MKAWSFRIGFALLLTHELDAVARSEWRVLPLTRWLPESVAFHAFVLLHVPLIAWLLWLTGHPDAAVRTRWQSILCIFLVVHVGLHMLFAGHAHYEFDTWMSNLLIFGAGAFGLLYLGTRERVE